MRPRLLELTAFGPYPGTVRIDFDQLADDGLFVVHGPTGAGKTSLLDAMTYALYGGVAGTRRNDRLRSDHAEPHTTTAVALELALRGEDFRVTRVPPHERAKKTGSGMTAQKPKATLSVRRGGDWQPLADGVEEVGRAVTELIGLNREQFTQVVVLPQGEIARALHADANERRRLLSSLFATGRFEQYSRSLADRARAAEAAVAEQEAALERLAQDARGRWALITHEEAVPDVADLAALADREAQVVADAAGLAAAEERDASAQLRAAELAADRWDRVARARAQLAELHAAADEVAEAKQRLDDADRARSLVPLLDAARRAADAADRAEHRLAGAVEDLRRHGDTGPAVDQAAVIAAARAGDLETLSADRERIATSTARLEAAAVRYEEWAELTRSASRRREEAAEARTRREDLESRRATVAADLAAVREQHAHAARVADRVPALRAEHARLAAAAAAAQRLPVLRERESAAAARQLLAKRELNTALDRQRDLLERRIGGMAAELAEALRDGHPCVVCGSPQHPRPAEPSGDVVTPDAVAAAADAVAGATASLDAADTAVTAARAELSEALAAAGEHGSRPEVAAQREQDAAAALADAERAAAGLADVDRHVAALASADASLTAELAEVTEQITAADGAAEQCDEAAGRLRDALGAGTTGEPSDPRPLLSASRAVAKALDTIVAAVEDARRCGRERATARRRLDRAVAEAGFADPTAVRDAALDDEAAARLRRLVEEVVARRAAAEAVLRDVEAPDEPPSVDAARERKDQADARLAATQVRLGVVAQAAADLQRLCAQHAEVARRLDASVQQAARLRRLADVCAGTGNTQRLSLERYVLAAYFEEIAEAASLRLQAMTGGRFSLRHSDARVRGGGASGLSIGVLDAYTGTEREAGSLSGGETFQASLALALAVADVVQRHAGGVHLDTLFVDEGFGALDPDSLDDAMAELDALREGGRLVGVISHVPALRGRIASGIEVVKTARGSDARVVTVAEV